MLKTWIQIIRQWCEHTSLWISAADLFWVVKNEEPCKMQLHPMADPFSICVLYVFVKRLLRNFYRVARNSEIISSCIFTLIGSQNAERKQIEKLTFEMALVLYMDSQYSNNKSELILYGRACCWSSERPSKTYQPMLGHYFSFRCLSKCWFQYFDEIRA